MSTVPETGIMKPFMAYPAQYTLMSDEKTIVGRERHLSKWAQWLRKESQKDATMLLIEGEAGIGKTTFTQQLMMELRQDFDFCVYGKSHSAPSRIPYLALKQCLHHWLDQLLLLEDQTFEHLKVQVTKAIHPHEVVLTSVLEELEVFFGKKASYSSELKSDPQKDRLRFTYYLHKFFRAVYDSGLKTAIFLDDLQWSDMATLNLVHELLYSYELPGLAILGAYRPIADVPGFKKIQKLRQSHQVQHFTLPPLKTDDLAQLIPSNWHLSIEEQKAFKEYLMHESGGKPFDALQLITLIVQEKLISPNSHTDFQISWDKLPRYNHDESTIRLIMREFKELNPHSLHLLQIASCMGFYFSCNTLQQLSRLESSIYQNALQELVQKKMLIIQQDACYFVHDHYVTAAQAQLTLAEKQDIHAAIALGLIIDGALDTQHPEFFNCVNHLNLSDLKKTGVNEGVLAILNFSAAALAKKISAFDRSLEYYQTIEKILFSTPEPKAEIKLSDVIPQYSWLPSPLLHNSLYHIYKLGRAESEFLVQNFGAADLLLHDIFEHVQDPIIRLKAYTIKIKICVASLNIKEAPLMLKDGMAIIETLLKDYQILLPQNQEEYQAFMHQAYIELTNLLPSDHITSLEHRALSEDQEFHDLIHLIVHSLPIIFFVNVEKSKYLAMRGIILCMQKGFTPSTPALFASSIWTLAALSKNYELAYQLGVLGLKLVESEPYRANRHTVYHLATLNYYNWKHHYRDSAAKLDEAYTYSLELGDHNYAIICYTNARIIDLFRGVPLSQHAYHNYYTKAQMLNINFASQGHAIFLKYMTGQEPGLPDGEFQFDRLLKHHNEENLNEIYHFSFVKEQLYLYTGQYPKALAEGAICEKHRTLYEALPIGNEHDFYYALILCQLAQDNGFMDADTRTLVEERLLNLKRLAFMGSGNYQHKQKILQAELARVDQQFLEALTYYDEAMEEAVRQDFIHLAALAAERCGDYLIRLKKWRLAEVYLNDARRYYLKWDAHAKVSWLEKTYPEIFLRDTFQPSSPTVHLMHGREELQWNLIQSAINISQELYINDLIHRVLQISVDQTQARHASFLLKQQFGWQVVAKMDEEGISMVHHNFHMDTPDDRHSTVYECVKRNEIRYIPHLTNRQMHYDREYSGRYEVHSLMAIPVDRHKEVLGLIYLENISPDLIDRNHLLPWFELLRIQTGIALSNAQLFDNQLKLNQEIRKQEQKRIDAVVETQEKERRRVAAELHDHLGQILALVKLNLSRLEDSLEGQFSLYLETSQLLDESCSELRRIAHDMMPPDLEKKPLSEILDDLFRKYLFSAGLTYHFYPDQVPEDLPLAVKFNLYRMTQEIIHNIIKHAQAQTVSIDLTTEDGRLHMMIADDGKGFDTHFKTDGLGLRNLYNRVKMLNGRIDIDSTIQKGSVFHIHIPML